MSKNGYGFVWFALPRYAIRLDAHDSAYASHSLGCALVFCWAIGVWLSSWAMKKSVVLGFCYAYTAGVAPVIGYGTIHILIISKCCVIVFAMMYSVVFCHLVDL